MKASPFDEAESPSVRSALIVQRDAAMKASPFDEAELQERALVLAKADVAAMKASPFDEAEGDDPNREGLADTPPQ